MRFGSMTGSKPSLFLAGLMLAACSSAAPQYRPLPARVAAPAPANVAARILSIHNRERAAAGVAPVVWDPALEAAAAGCARGLAASGGLRHSNRQARRGTGENLWMGARGYWPVETMVASWTNERRNFRAGIFPNVSRTGNWMDIGHYSQMIWPTTTRIGCAIGTSKRWDALVCRYAPAGNIDNRRVP